MKNVAKSLAAMAYDSESDRIIMFGSYSSFNGNVLLPEHYSIAINKPFFTYPYFFPIRLQDMIRRLLYGKNQL